MNKIIAQINEQLVREIDQKEPGETMLIYYKRCQHAVREALKLVKKEMLDHRFEAIPEEINFFKYTIPSFLEKDIYYTELYDLEIEKSALSKEELQQYIKEELREIDRFIFKNKTLYVYMLKEETDLDSYYFTVHGTNSTVYDPHFCTLNSIIIARLSAVERYRKTLLSEEIYLIQSNKKTPAEILNIEFTGTDADLVEIIPPIVKLGLIKINGIPVTQDLLAKAADLHLGSNIQSNFSVIDSKNRSRKKSTTPFLTRLIQACETRNDELLK